MKKTGFLTRMRSAWTMFRADGGMGVQLPPWDDAWYASRGYQTATGLRVSPESAMRVASVFACVRVVAETIASLPLIIYRKLPDGGKERATNHPLYYLLHDSPNQWQTVYEWLEMMQGHLELRGNAYSLIESQGPAGIDALVPLHPDRVIVKRLTSGRLQYSVRDFYGGDIKTYAQEEILHLRGLSADGLVGMSTISVGAEVVANALATQEYASRFFENDATPPIAFIHQKTLGADAYVRLKTSLNEAHGGANHHKPIILEEGMDAKMLGLNNKDSQMLEARQFSRGDISSMFRVPPHKMGDLTRATFSNIEQQNIEFATDCIRPRLVRLEKRIQKDLIEPLSAHLGEQYFCEFLMEALMRGDQKSRYASYAIGRQWGWLSVNDVRALESMNPVGPQGDIYLSPLNMQDVGSADPDKLDEGSAQQDSTGEGAGTGASLLQGFVRAAAERSVRKEVRALRKIADRKPTPAQLQEELETFYQAHAEFLAQAMRISQASAMSYAAENQQLASDNMENAIPYIESCGTQHLIELAMPALKQANRQLSTHAQTQIHVEPHIHITQPEICIQPMEVKVTTNPPEPAKKPIKTVKLERRNNGQFDFVIEEQDPQLTSGTVQRDRDGSIKVLMGGREE